MNTREVIAAQSFNYAKKYCLAVELLEDQGQSLRAPVEGSMRRTIHESLCATVRYRFWSGKEILFQHIDRYASFEYSDQQYTRN